ncbi:MAG: hypothetical protein AAFR24_03650 [Cyanobacteria bacterium J06627_3]
MQISWASLAFQLLFSVLSSLLASIIVILYLRSLVPNVEISGHISEHIDDDDGKVFRVKVINKGPRPIINVKLRMHLVHVTTHRSNIKTGRIGATKRLRSIKLLTEEVPEISRFDLADEFADYACTFRTSDDIEQRLRNGGRNCYIRFTFSAVDPFSNFGRVFVRTYDISSIRSGLFEHGNSTNVSPLRKLSKS